MYNDLIISTHVFHFFILLLKPQNCFWYGFFCQQNVILVYAKKGANIFNRKITRTDIRAAKVYGVQFVRIAPDKFRSSKKDFLMGNADHYACLVPEDLAELKKVLDMCAEEGMPIVLTMLSLPGTRWKQHNKNRHDLRLWTDKKMKKQAIQFWQDLAKELKDHPIVVGYNLLNEPALERVWVKTNEINEVKHPLVQQTLFQFYREVIDAIRAIDKKTPIIVDSSARADPQTFKNLMPQSDDKLLYSFHMYEPYAYTNHRINKGRFGYPGMIDGIYWNKGTLEDHMKEVVFFQKKYKIPRNRILVGEFGCYRKTKGICQYFKDLIDIFNKNGWHFAFYAFREDTWSGMDYELGEQKLPWNYRQIKKDPDPVLSFEVAPAVFKVLLNAQMIHEKR